MPESVSSVCLHASVLAAGHRRQWLAGAAVVLLAPCWSVAGELPVECHACNGSPLLCDRRYDQVAYATTHNSMSNRRDLWLAPNQNFGITRQLNDGIRCLMIDVHSFLGRPYLAHSNVLFGRKLLVKGLTEVREFLAARPCEVVTIILENYVQPPALAEAFTGAGLDPYLYVHQPGQPFPTLREMVLSGKRLVVFTDNGGGAYPWLHPVWDFCVDTPWNAKHPGDLANQVGRGNPHNPLLIVNHFLMNPLPSSRYAKQVNRNPFLMERVARCQQEMQRMPNFIVVDFYDIGDLFNVVDAINGSPLTAQHGLPQVARPVAGVVTPGPQMRTAGRMPSQTFMPAGR